jgi:cysteine desulfurase
MEGRHRIYLDHAATTPLRAEVLAAMVPHLSPGSGNPSAVYAEGREAREVLEAAREVVRNELEADDFDVVFLSGGTEADNAAVLGTLLEPLPAGRPCRRIVTSATEHPAVLNVRTFAERLGAEWVETAVDSDGRVVAEDVMAQLDERTALVSIMAANNETGVLQPIAVIGEVARARGVVFHTDAVQYLGKAPFSLRKLPVDLVSISGHKIGGPRGIAALLVRRGVSLASLLQGGAQESGRRAGTENVAAAVGFATAVRCAVAECESTADRLGVFRDQLRDGLLAAIPWARVNTPQHGALQHFLNVSFPRVEGESLLRTLDRLGVAASTGSACNVGAGKLSHVLRAMGRDERTVRGSLRLSMAASTLSESADDIVGRVVEAVESLVALAPSRGAPA